MSPDRLGAILSVLLGAIAQAQQSPPPADAPPGSQATAAPRKVGGIELRGHSLPLPSTQPDVSWFAIENLQLRFVDEDVEIRADRAVIWCDPDLARELLAPSAGSGDSLHAEAQIPLAPDRPPLPRVVRTDPAATVRASVREIYAEGHVLFREGPERTVLCERLYENLIEQRGLLFETDLYARQQYQQRAVPLHVRAERARVTKPDELVASGALVTTCDYGHPHYHVKSGSLKLDLETVEPTLHQAEAGRQAHAAAVVATADNTFEVEDLPVLPLPPYTARVEEGETVPLKKVRAGKSTRFGFYGQTLWGGELADVAELLDEELGLSKPLDLRYEAAIDAYSKRGAGLGPALDWKVPGLIEGDVGGYWIHDRQDVDSSIPFAIDHADRGRAYLRDRYTPDEHWRLDTEVQYFSDANFEREFFEREFKEEKEPESYAHLVRQDETTRLRFLYLNRLNDFQTQTSSVPRASFDQLGFPLVELPLPSFLERDGKPNQVVLSHSTDVADLRLQPADGSTLQGEHAARADEQLDLSTTIPLGPASLRPFTGAEFTGWDRNSNDDRAIGRAAGLAGARAQLMLHRDFDAWSPLLGVDGLRHAILLDADYVNVYDVSRAPREIVQIDPVDAVDEREVYVLGVHQRLQTHRGNEIVDFVDLDLDAPLYPHATRDNPVGPGPGQNATTLGPLRYEFVTRPDLEPWWLKKTTIFSDGHWDFHDRAFDDWSGGFSVRPTEDWSTSASYRDTRGLSRVITGELDWLLTEKWSVGVLEQYDLRGGQGLAHKYLLRRHGHDFIFELDFERNNASGNTSISFAIYPTFFRRHAPERSLAAGRGDEPGLDPGKF